jgi:hypothetical protein
MAHLRFDLDIDSEVHPELYAKLASMERLPAREEKLRQLAATGLIWEIVRLHGPAFADPNAASSTSQAPARAEPPAVAGLPPEVIADEAQSEVSAEAPGPEPVPAPEAEPAPSEVSAVDAGAVDDHVPHVPANVPVLHDVVDETEMADASPVDAAEAALALVMSLSKPMPPPSIADEPPPPAPTAEVPSGKGRSARMKRMKDSGLFQNG